MQEAAVAVAAAAGANDGSVKNKHASASVTMPGCETTGDNGDVGDVEVDDVDTGEETEDEDEDEAGQARFVAFVLHSLTGESLPRLEGFVFRSALTPERRLLKGWQAKFGLGMTLTSFGL